MYITCTASKTVHVLLMPCSAILQSYNNVNLRLMNMIFKIHVFYFAPLYYMYMQEFAYWILMHSRFSKFTHIILLSCSTIRLNFYNITYTWWRFSPSYHTEQHFSYMCSLVMCRYHLVLLCKYILIFSFFQ